MSARSYLAVSGLIFFVIGVMHLLRIFYHWPVQVGSRLVPQAASYLGLPLAWVLSYWAIRLLRR